MNLLRAMSGALNEAGLRDLSYWTIVGRMDQFLVGMLVGWVVVRRRPQPGRGAAWGGLMASAVLVLVVMTVFNSNGGWLSSEPWKIVWPLVEGLMWGTFAFAYILASRSMSRRCGGGARPPGDRRLLRLPAALRLRGRPARAIGASSSSPIRGRECAPQHGARW